MPSLLRSLGLTAAALACAGALVGWNFSRFIGVRGKIYTKDLAFLPSPEVAKLLCLGHNNTVGKLRWIDSFAYFQFQIDHRNDSVSGGGTGGFKRLYDTLVELDPLFEPFYQHAALCTGGLLGQNYLALGYLQRGLLYLPHQTSLWRHAAAMLFGNFNLEERDPQQMDSFLAAWEEAETEANEKQQVLQWKAKMALRKFKGLEKLPYWQQQLEATTPGSPLSDFIEGVMREQLAGYALTEFAALLAQYRQQHGAEAEDLVQLLDPGLLLARYGKTLPAASPISLDQGRLAMKPDPYGFPFRLNAGKPVSPGREREHFAKFLAGLNTEIEEKARASGKRPTSLAEVSALGVSLPTPPRSGHLVLNQQAVDVEYDEKPGKPWNLHAAAR